MNEAKRKRIYDYIIAKGVEDRGGDFRFAVHEAFHAMHLELESDWDSESINDAIMERPIGFWLLTEVMARACEWTIFEKLGESYDLTGWSFVSFMEGCKNAKLQMPDCSVLETAIKNNKRGREVKAIAKRIMSLR